MSASQRTIDLNADLGESFGVWGLGDDQAMLRLVTRANIACGFHAGDPAGLTRPRRAAVEEGVRIGAQVAIATSPASDADTSTSMRRISPPA